MKHRSFWAVSCSSFALLFFASVARATPPASARDRTTIPGRPSEPPSYTILDLSVAEATAQIGKIATWDVTMQSTSCTDPDAGPDASATACEEGGIIEVESGPGMAIVASDNTQETIGIWSINQKLNDVSHLSNIAAAFDYLGTHPGYLAWKVAGDPGPADYYSVYNCGWGVRAVMLYEATTSDTSHHAYGVDCANHIAMYAAGLVNTDAELIDVGPPAWAASGLWLWGDTYGDASLKTTAAAIGAKVKSWIETTPSRLSSQQWAMTGAVAFYGVLKSYMLENPGELTAWDSEYAPMLGGWIDESKPDDPNDWTDWRNAWNGWNMLAHFTSSDVLGTKAGSADLAVATDILNKLVAQADPTTGAIAGSQQRPSTEAESWITAYMVYFGLLHVIDAPPPGADAGVEAGATDAATKDAAQDGASVRDGGSVSGSSSSSSSSSGCALMFGDERAETGAPLAGLAWVVAAAARRRRRSS